ncbi:MAG: non-canonical purine NTP pyrophosphatase [Candidatus Shapirobacteria bacterium]|nr:non-canonical purine NTP pyrophosphatase [Candidatus Shapirobacteria bacterium]
MQDILIATTNQNKVGRIKRLLDLTKINVLSLKDLNYQIDPPKETGQDGLENALLKANYYYHNLKSPIPVLSQDENIFLAEVSPDENPGKDIKLPVINTYGEFNDENAKKYYTNLVRKYNKKFLNLEINYSYALCWQPFLQGSTSILSARLFSQPNTTNTPGYFLADLMKLKSGNTWKYFSDLTEQELIYQDRFAQKILNDLIKKIL